LHEVGKSKKKDGDDSTRPKRGYRMVSRLKPPLGWSEEEMRCVAVLVRYHSGDLPLTSNSSFVGLSAKWRSEIMPLIGILRLANAFDQAHDGSISRVTVERQDGFLIVYGQGLRRISRGAERVARARYLLETTSRFPIMVRPMPAKTIASSRPIRLKRPAAAVS
jgi:exopolyphosphatase/pppGpp-phosphohydrolase